MSNINLIKELRERTQAGFLDCKKALEESDNDIERAIILLKEKGMLKAEKKAGAIACEGVTNILLNNGKALIIEVNSQTDFVAQNSDFLDLVNQMSEVIINADVVEHDEVNDLQINNSTSIKEACANATATIGEKISFRRAGILKFNENKYTLGSYIHHNKKFASMILIKGIIEKEVANNIAMHVGALNPKFLNKESVDQNWLESERKILIQKTIDEGKPKEFAEKIIEGRMKKILAEYCLDQQQFAKDPTISVANYLKNNGNGTLKFMIRYEVGEGIEKIETNFAEEVASQIKK